MSACGGPGANDEAVMEERTEPRPAAAAGASRCSGKMHRAGEISGRVRVMASTVITAHAAGTSPRSIAQLLLAAPRFANHLTDPTGDNHLR